MNRWRNVGCNAMKLFFIFVPLLWSLRKSSVFAFLVEPFTGHCLAKTTKQWHMSLIQSLVFSHKNPSQRHMAFVIIGGLILVAGCGVAKHDQSSSSKNAAELLERVTTKGPVRLTVRITPREPRLSDLIEMDVEVTAPRGIEILPPTFGQAVGDFIVRDYGERSGPKLASPQLSTSQPDSETTSRLFHYKLEPVHAGRHLIHSIAMDFIDNRPNSEQKGQEVLIESDPLEVNVTSDLGDKRPNLADLEPMLPPRPLSPTTQWIWLVLVVVIGLIGAGVIWLRRRQRRTLINEPPRQTPEEIAHAAFAALLSENLPARGLFKEFYLRLTGIVRHFIEGTTGLHAPEQTTEEFLREMRSRDIFSTERSVRLAEFLEAADMVKYAGQQPDEDQIELSILRAREFVHFSSPQSAEPVAVPVEN